MPKSSVAVDWSYLGVVFCLIWCRLNLLEESVCVFNLAKPTEEDSAI